MAISLVQTKSGSSGAYTSTFNFSFTSNISGGNLLVLNVTAGTADVQPTITDNKSNTWNLAVNSKNPTSGERQSWLFYVTNANAGATTVTVTYGSGSPDSSFIAREYSGLATASPLDVTSTNNDGTNFNQTHDAGTTAATAIASELVILGGGSSASADPVHVAGSGYGNGLEQKGFDTFTYSFMSDKTITSVGTQSGNFTSTGFVRGQGFIATFKAAVSTVTLTLPLLGVG